MFLIFQKFPPAIFSALTAQKFKSVSPKKIEPVLKVLNYLLSDQAKLDLVYQRALQLRKRIDDLPRDNNHTKAFASLTKELIQLERIKLSQRFHDEWCTHYSDSTWWESQISHASAEIKASLAKQRDAWQVHGKYAAFSTPDLVRVYLKVMPVFSDWLKFANKEYQHKRKRLSPELAQSYQVHLDNLAENFKQEKSAMRASLQARLLAGVRQNDLHFDDLIVSTTTRLQGLGVLPQSVLAKCKGVRRMLMPKLFADMRFIIDRDGSDDQKNALNNLLIGTQDFALRLNQNGSTFVVPASVSHYVSTSPPFYTKLPKWMHGFFKGTKISFEFFQNDVCQYLLIAQQRLSNGSIEANITLSKLYDSSAWRSLHKQFNYLAIEAQRTQSTLDSLSKLFHSAAYQLLLDYQHNLINLGQTLVRKQLLFLEKIVINLEAVANHRCLSEEERQQLKGLIDHISDHQKKYCGEGELKFTDLIMRCSCLHTGNPPVMRNEQTFTQAAKLASQIADGREVTTDDLTTLEVAQESLPNRKDFLTSAQVSFVLHNKIVERNLLILLKEELSKDPLTLTSVLLIEHIQRIKCFIAAVYERKPSLMSSTELQVELYRYVHRFLFAVTQFNRPVEFKKMSGAICFIVKTLEICANGDDSLLFVLEQLKTLDEKFKSLDWDIFKEFKLKPLVDALADCLQGLNMQGLAQEHKTGGDTPSLKR